MLRCLSQEQTGGLCGTVLDRPYNPSTNFQENTMKTLRTLCAAVALILMLSLPTMAGDIPTWVVSPPPPPPPASATATDPGEITTWGPQSPLESEALVTELTLSVLQLLSVF
jgi:hypothetical protein